MKTFRKIFTILFLTTLSLTPVVWFVGKGSAIINGIDTNFPLDPLIWFLRRLYVWTDFPNAGQDFSSSTAGFFFHLIQLIPYKLGFDIQHVQIISLVFWFSLIIFSSYLLARILFPKSVLVQFLFVTLYSFNIYLFNTWENVKVANLALVSAIPLALSILLLLEKKVLSRVKALLFFGLIGIVLSGSGINPSYFICFILIVFIFLLSQLLQKFDLKNFFINLLIFVIPIFLVNLFWILPTTVFVLTNVAPGGSLDKIGFTNWVDSLSENTSLVNVIRLQGAWDWYVFDGMTGLPVYIPYALNYFFKPPFVIFSFLLPAIAVLSLALRRGGRNYLYVAFGTMFALGVFLGAGTHLPTGSFFKWLSIHLPFFTIFRSPWYIFTPLTILSLAGLVSLFFYRFYQDTYGNSRSIKFKFLNYVLSFSVFILIIGNLVYSYPLVTGKIFRPTQPDGFFVKFPSYTQETKKWLDTQEGFRIVSYPDDEIEKFNWGYRGIESVLGLLSKTEVIFSPLNDPDSNVAVLIREFYKDLKKDEIVAATALAQKLNIGLIFEKEDQESLSPKLSEKVKGNAVANFGGWRFYKFPQDANAKIYSPTNLFLGPIRKEGARVISVLPKEGVLLNQEDTVVKSIDTLKNYYGFVLFAKNSQEEEFKNFAYSESKLNNRLISRDLSKADFNINVSREGDYSPILERYKLEDFGIKVDENLEVEVDGNNVTWIAENYSDSYLRFNKIYLSRGEHKIRIKLKNENLVFGGDFNSGMVFNKGGYGEGQGEYSINEDANGKFLQIFNVNKSNVTADFQVSSFDPFTAYYVDLRYKQIYGNNATVVVLQGTNKTLVKAQTERIPNYPEWNNFSFYYEPVQTNSSMSVDLESPFTSDSLGTKILYDDLRVFKVFANELLFIKEGNNKFNSAPNIEFNKKSPVTYEGEVSQVKGPHLIVFSENYSPNWKLIVMDKEGKEMNRNFNHFSSNIYSNAWYVDVPAENYKFRIFYKNQNLFLIGSLISLFTIILLIIAVFKNLHDKKN